MGRIVFYLDDDASQLELFSEMFRGEHDVRTSASPSEALRVLAECDPDIIISDQSMPEADGTEFLREAALMCPRSIRILLSGYVQIGDVLEEVGAGIINIFIPKPWDEEHMRRVLERAGAEYDSPDRSGRSEGERRIAPRHAVRLDARVLLIAEREAAGGAEELLTLTGYTHDISESGLALIVTGEDVRALSGLGDAYTLRLVLTLPAGPVELTVAPVRFQRLGESEESDSLMGTHITDMSGRDRVRFMSYIRGLARHAQT